MTVTVTERPLLTPEEAAARKQAKAEARRRKRERMAATATAIESPLLNPDEARVMLRFEGNSNHSLRRLEKANLLVPIRINSRTLRYARADIQKLIDDRRGK